MKSQPKKIDWVQAKLDFVSDATMSFKQVADKYKVARATVEQHAKDEDWLQARENLAQLAESRAMKKLAGERVDVDQKHLRASRGIQKAIEMRIKGIELDTEAGERIGSQSLRHYVASWKEAVTMERLILGLPTNINRNENQEIPVPKELTPDMEAQMVEELLKRESEANEPSADTAS